MPALAAEHVPGLLRTGASTRMPDQVAPRFKDGDQVRVRNVNPATHTRLPRYARGKRGVVVRDYGVFSFNDTVAHNQGHKPQHVYSVKFTALELWGEGVSAQDSLYLDMFDDYLEPA